MPVVESRGQQMSTVTTPFGGHRILMADDSQNDHLLMLMAAEETGLPLEFNFVDDGVHLLVHLSRIRTVSELPDLIVLDLRMPHVDGFRSLELLRDDPVYREIPVAILTTSSSDRDRTGALTLGADAFWTKPSSFWSTKDLVKDMRDFAEARAGFKDALSVSGDALDSQLPSEIEGEQPLVFEITDEWTM